MKFYFEILIIVLVLAATGAANVFAQNRRQISFSMEESFKSKHRIPKYVMRQIIKSDDFNETIISSLDERTQATLVNLNNDKKPDLLVQGDNGANIGGFWLFRNVAGKWKLVLYSRAHSLSLLPKFTESFRDVEISAASAVTLWVSAYKFDGSKYVPKTCWEADLKMEKLKKKYFPCSDSSVKPYR